MNEKIPDNIKDLNEQEQRLINMIRETKAGRLYILVAAGKPVRVEVIKKSIEL